MSGKKREVKHWKHWMHEMILPRTAVNDFTEANRIWWDLPTRQKVLETRSRHYYIHTVYTVTSLSTSKAAVTNMTMT